MPFRFLELHPELRNTVYEFLYPSQQSPISIDLADLPSFVPSRSLTLASRELRRETLTYYCDATNQFWHSTFRYTPARHSELDYLASAYLNPAIGPHLRALRSIEIAKRQEVHTLTRREFPGSSYFDLQHATLGLTPLGFNKYDDMLHLLVVLVRALARKVAADKAAMESR